MATTRKSGLFAVAGFTIGQLLIGAPPLAAQSECKVILDAESKLLNTPTHAYGTMNLGGHAQTTETIYVAGSIYVKAGGKWTTGGTTKEMEQLMLKNRQETKMTCRYVKNEAQNGKMAALYSSHEEPRKGTLDTQSWISKANGLLVRQEIDIDGGKSHMSTRFEYDNVKPPM
jgi:hypothetical protein